MKCSIYFHKIETKLYESNASNRKIKCFSLIYNNFVTSGLLLSLSYSNLKKIILMILFNHFILKYYTLMIISRPARRIGKVIHWKGVFLRYVNHLLFLSNIMLHNIRKKLFYKELWISI